MTRPGSEPRSPGPLANTLTIMPMSGKEKELKSMKVKKIFKNYKREK